MKKFICPYCGNDLLHHAEFCGEIGQANTVPELHPVAEFLESIPMCVRIIATAMIAVCLGYGISVIGSML